MLFFKDDNDGYYQFDDNAPPEWYAHLTPTTQKTIAAAVVVDPSITNYGIDSLKDVTTGTNNAAFGSESLWRNTTGERNTAIGAYTLRYSLSGYANTAVGDRCLYSNDVGFANTGLGSRVLFANTSGYFNTALGSDSMQGNLTGINNTGVGKNTLYTNTDGSDNFAGGLNALYSCTNGSYNTAVGSRAGFNLTTGKGNVIIGMINSAGVDAPAFNVTTQDNYLSLGTTSITNAYVNVAWAIVSDERDKTNFGEVPHGIDFVKQLKPISYQRREHRKSDNAVGDVKYGFKAQEVLALEGGAPVIVDNSDEERLRFNDSNLLAVLVKAIQDQQEKIELLELKITQSGSERIK